LVLTRDLGEAIARWPSFRMTASFRRLPVLCASTRTNVSIDGPAPGTLGLPSGAWAVRGNLATTRHSLGLSIPPGVTNLLPFASGGRSARLDEIATFIKDDIRPSRAPIPASDLIALQGRVLFGKVGLVQPSFSCATCHGGPNWSKSVVDFTPPPSPDVGLGFGNEQVIGAGGRPRRSRIILFSTTSAPSRWPADALMRCARIRPTSARR
jgi:hypothetical protein